MTQSHWTPMLEQVLMGWEQDLCTVVMMGLDMDFKGWWVWKKVSVLRTWWDLIWTSRAGGFGRSVYFGCDWTWYGLQGLMGLEGQCTLAMMGLDMDFKGLWVWKKVSVLRAWWDLICTSRAGGFGRRSVYFGHDGTWYGFQGLVGLEGQCTSGVMGLDMHLKGWWVWKKVSVLRPWWDLICTSRTGGFGRKSVYFGRDGTWYGFQGLVGLEGQCTSGVMGLDMHLKGWWVWKKVSVLRAWWDLIWTSRTGGFGRSVYFRCDGTWYGPQRVTGLEQNWCTLGIVAFHLDLKVRWVLKVSVLWVWWHFIWTSRADVFRTRSVHFERGDTSYGSHRLMGLQQGQCTVVVMALHMDLRGLLLCPVIKGHCSDSSCCQ